METAIIFFLIFFFISNFVLLNLNVKFRKTTDSTTIILLNKASELEKLAKDIEVQDTKLSGRVTELGLIKRINEDTFNKQLDEMYLGGLELKKFTEETIKTLDPILNRDILKNLNENLLKINIYLEGLQKQSSRNLNDVNYKTLCVKYNFSNN